MKDVFILNEEVVTTIDFLVNYGMNENSIANGLNRNRDGKTNYYHHFPDPYDGRKKLIVYGSLPPQNFRKFNLPIPEQLLMTIEEEKRTSTLDLIRKTMYHAYEVDYIHCIKNFVGHFKEKEVIDTYARTNSVFRSMMTLKANGMEVQLMFPIYQEFTDTTFKCSSLKSFYNKLNRFDKDGFMVFIHKSYRMARSSRKVTDQHLKEIERLFRDTELHSIREIRRRLNIWAVKNGYSELCKTTVQEITSDTHFQNRNRPYRNGKEWLIKNYDSYRDRLEPEFNGTLWQIDGTRLQIAFLGEKGEIVYFQLFVVMDVHSRKIIGYSWDTTENSKLIIEALRMAIETTGYVPREMVRDNGGAFRKKVYQELEEKMTLLGSYIRPHAPQHPQDKAHVERFFGKLQTCILKYIPGYVGEGIKSRRKEGRPPKEILDRINKGIGIHSSSEVHEVIPELIHRYNEFSMNENDYCPRLRYEIAKIDPVAKKVSDHDLARMFWENKSMKVRRSMIVMTEESLRRKKFQYIIQHEELRLSWNLKEVNVYFQKNDRSIIKLFDKNDDWITDVKLSPKVLSVRKRITKPSEKLNDEKAPSQEDFDEFNQLFKQDPTFRIHKPKTDDDDE